MDFRQKICPIVVSPYEVRRQGPLILKSDWLFLGHYFLVLGPVGVSLPVQRTRISLDVKPIATTLG